MSSRPLAALSFLVLAVLGLLVMLPDYASACSSAGGDFTAKQEVEWALSDPNSVVFSGEVVKVESMMPEEAMFAYTLRVSEVWKGPERGTLQVNTRDPALCGYHFREGQEYLVFAYEGKRALKVDGTVGTKPLSEADADLALLGEGEEPTDGADALNDTSGVVRARTMVGVACLAMAASFLLVARLVRAG